MEKGAIFGWLSMVHWLREFRKLQYPDIPTLAKLVEVSNRFEWSDQCYVGMQELERVVELPFGDYLQQFGDDLSRAGSCVAYPITFGEDDRECMPHNHDDTTETLAVRNDGGVLCPGPDGGNVNFLTDRSDSVVWTSEDGDSVKWASCDGAWSASEAEDRDLVN
ncbi:hypothetical protein KC19_VG257400 [Ceratodon purpureus]|uniref:Uncharacterized protein n=1 Tax=Ceratodon purpureus TaxID=3225 RepID=A0A8T0HTS4_CERPU|nr:hypothetical protein KC19_VG257400 [Ceratodon purpureus]